MSELKNLKILNARFNYDKLSNWGVVEKSYQPEDANKINVRGKETSDYSNPLIRIREDKLRSFKRALYNSYQSAVIVFDKDDRQYHFRCLINHDKLKVDYEDKILSIPFRQVPLELQEEESSIEDKIVDTGTPGRFLDELGKPILNSKGQVIYQYRVKPGDTFKWVSGNQGYMPDSYWIIFLQYSEQTAYFRGQIRKADDQIQVIPIDQDGEQGEPVLYHGWTTGPNEDQAIWNVKKGVIWNDLYYSKILYITKDQTTEAFFKRFDRVVINGQTWEVQGYNDNYGTSSKNAEGGMIRVALKETYTSTNQVIKEMKQEAAAAPLEILGPSTIQTYDVVTYRVPEGTGVWTISPTAPVKVLSSTNTQLKLEVGQVVSNQKIQIQYGENIFEVTIKPFK